MTRLPSHFRVGGDSPQVWYLPKPVGDVQLLIANETTAQPTELTFRGGGFGSPAGARAAGRLLSDWLRLAGALEGIAFDLGRDLALSGLGEVVKPIVDAQLRAQGAFAVPDVHGLTVYEYEEPARPTRFATRAQGTVERTSESLRGAVLLCSSRQPLDDRLALACDLVCLAEREISNRARFLTLVSAAEVLAVRSQRMGVARSLVDKFIAEVKSTTTSAVEPELDSLLSALLDLREISVSASIRELARTARPDAPEGAADIARRSYNCRSELTHGGRSATDVKALYAEMLPLVRDMVQIARPTDDVDQQGAGQRAPCGNPV